MVPTSGVGVKVQCNEHSACTESFLSYVTTVARTWEQHVCRYLWGTKIIPLDPLLPPKPCFVSLNHSLSCLTGGECLTQYEPIIGWLVTYDLRLGQSDFLSWVFDWRDMGRIGRRAEMIAPWWKYHCTTKWKLTRNQRNASDTSAPNPSVASW